jgi:hypothetical protein
MNTETRIQTHSAHAPDARCGGRESAEASRAPTGPQFLKRREGMFAPLAAFASLAGIAGVPFVSL